MAAVRVVIIDDEYLVRAGLRLLLDGVAGIEVVGEGADGVDALPLVHRFRPDVVCMDIRMPRVDGIAATRGLAGSGVAVLILTAFDTDGFILDAMDAGAVGFLLKDAPPQTVIDAVTAAAAGEARFSPRVIRRLVALAGAQRQPAREAAAARFATLTEREQEVARAVAEGLSNAEVAAQLYLSPPTVKTHLARVFDKLQVSNRVQVALAVRDAAPPSVDG